MRRSPRKLKCAIHRLRFPRRHPMSAASYKQPKSRARLSTDGIGKDCWRWLQVRLIPGQKRERCSVCRPRSRRQLDPHGRRGCERHPKLESSIESSPGDFLRGDRRISRQRGALHSRERRLNGRTNRYGLAVGARTIFTAAVFEYLRNDKFDSRSPFDGKTLPPFRLNQFGASPGGRLIKDRTFFFVTYEGLRQRRGQTLIGFVPSQEFEQEHC